jgi:hypothetical protein
MAAELLPADAVAATDLTRVNVSVRVVGETLGGTEIRSSELIFPINVCRGCLVSFPNEAVDPLDPSGAGPCVGTDEPSGPDACLRGQDAFTDCRYCATTNGCCANQVQTSCP